MNEAVNQEVIERAERLYKVCMESFNGTIPSFTQLAKELCKSDQYFKNLGITKKGFNPKNVKADVQEWLLKRLKEIFPEINIDFIKDNEGGPFIDSKGIENESQTKISKTMLIPENEAKDLLISQQRTIETLANLLADKEAQNKQA